MSVSYSEIFDVATTLSKQRDAEGGPCEASLRSAASRAYYAALHAAISTIPDQFMPTEAELESKDSHKTIIDAVAAWGNSLTPGRTEAKMMGREFPRLKRLRKNADYGISSDFTTVETDEAIARATKILRNVKIATAKCSPAQQA